MISSSTSTSTTTSTSTSITSAADPLKPPQDFAGELTEQLHHQREDYTIL